MRLAVAGFAFLLASGATLCQNPEPKQVPPPAKSQPETDPKNTGQTGGTTQTPPKDAPAAQKFPYPGETGPAPDPSADATRAPSPAMAPSGSAAGKSFPYPGDPDAGESSSSSASSSSAAPVGGDIPADAEAPHRRRLPREFHPQSAEDRATEDLEVARFYRDKGDLQAAYLRAQDAVKTLPNDPEGHFLVGQIAQQMKHRDEAVAAFKNYLRLEPDGDHVKEARRSLSQMH